MFRSTLPLHFQSSFQQDVSEFAKILLDKVETEQLELEEYIDALKVAVNNQDIEMTDQGEESKDES